MPTITLEPLDTRHEHALTRLIADPGVLRFTRIPEPPPENFARTWIERYRTARVDGSAEGFAAVDAVGQFVGLGLAPEINPTARELELGYIVAAEARGQGIATEILRQLTAWALRELGALRIYLIIDVENHASLKVAERCGYVREGVLRSIHVKQGKRSDATVWSRLPSDPDPAVSRPPSHPDQPV